MGTSQPPTESVVASLIGTPADTGIDLHQTPGSPKYLHTDHGKNMPGLLNPISERVDSDVLIYQLPGGHDLQYCIAVCRNRTHSTGWDEVLAEIPRVRKDLGYPPLVTPTSQIVGTQAVLNVLVNGQRYRNVTKEVKDYVRGLYGKSPASGKRRDPKTDHR